MGYTTESIEKDLRVQSTSQDKGLVLTIEVICYDSGMVCVNGRPINREGVGQYNESQGWTGALAVIAGHVQRFAQHTERRKARKDRQVS